jgi:hypothetical protein
MFLLFEILIQEFFICYFCCQKTAFNTELAIHALGQVHCPMSILEPKLGFSKNLPPSIFNHL